MNEAQTLHIHIHTPTHTFAIQRFLHICRHLNYHSTSRWNLQRKLNSELYYVFIVYVQGLISNWTSFTTLPRLSRLCTYMLSVFFHTIFFLCSPFFASHICLAWCMKNVVAKLRKHMMMNVPWTRITYAISVELHRNRRRWHHQWL